MHILDLIILLAIIAMGIRGAMKGFISQIVGLISLFAAVWVASRYSVKCAAWIKMQLALDTSSHILNIILFIIVFLLVILTGRLIAKMLEGVINLSMMGWLNRILGAIFSALAAIVIIGIALYFFESINSTLEIVSANKFNTSKTYILITNFTAKLFPYIKLVF